MIWFDKNFNLHLRAETSHEGIIISVGIRKRLPGEVSANIG